jgi:hypothetical protein
VAALVLFDDSVNTFVEELDSGMMSEIVSSNRKQYSLKVVPVENAEMISRDYDSPIGLPFNARFRENTDADLAKLVEDFDHHLKEFTILNFPSKLAMFKALHYLHEEGKIYKECFEFFDSLAVEPYFESSPLCPHESNYVHAKYLFREGILSNCSGKWIVLQDMKEKWAEDTTSSFYDEAISRGVLGVMFNTTAGTWCNFDSASELYSVTTKNNCYYSTAVNEKMPVVD